MYLQRSTRTCLEADGSAPLPETVRHDFPGFRVQAVAGLTISRRRAIRLEARSFTTGFWPVRCAALLAAFALAHGMLAQGNPPTSTSQPASTGAGVPSSGNPATPGNLPQASQTTAPVASQVPAPGSLGATESGQLVDVRPALATTVWQERGKQVSDVRFDGVVFSKGDTLLDQLTQKAGTKLDPEAVRADLRRLFASGRYRDISAGAQRNDRWRHCAGVCGSSAVLRGPGADCGGGQRAAVVAAGVCNQAGAWDGVHRGAGAGGGRWGEAVAGAEWILRVQSRCFDDQRRCGRGRWILSSRLCRDRRRGLGIWRSKATMRALRRRIFCKKAKLNCGIFGRTFSHDCRPKVTQDTTSTGLANLRKQY